MILIDLFGEDVATNVRVLYVLISDKMDDIAGYIRPGAKDFSLIKSALWQ